MWPDSKGKGGKEGSPKSKDGGGESSKPNAGASGTSSGGKGKIRNTKTKMKAMSATNLPAQDKAQAAAMLEQEIIKAAQNLTPSQGRTEETKTLIELNAVPPTAMMPGGEGAAPGLMRLPEGGSENMEDKISSLWKSRVLGAYRANPRASQHILPAMPNNRGALEITDKARCDAQQAAMITAIDKMFDCFQNLAFEFNSMAQASDLELTWIRPTISRENISSWHQAAQVISVFTGRISTRRWTMVVRGTLDGVFVVVIPADKLLSFTNQPANFQPVIELIPTATGLTVRWSVMGRIVTQDELANIYRALLDNMIRIAQDDAPCDQLIDLAAYGIVLNGEMDPGMGGGQAPSEVIGQDINYGAKYQQQFMSDDSTSTELPSVPSLSPGQINNPFASPNDAGNAPSRSQSDSFVGGAGDAIGASSAGGFGGSLGGGSSSADWKPVVRTVRGANPPVPATPMPGIEGSLPTTPGFNQDEPWKYASGSLPPGQVNPSINSFNSRAGGGSQSFAGPGGGGRVPVPGNQNDEPPLPSLPAHLFEGLPARPQNLQSGSYGQAQTGPQPVQAPSQPLQVQPTPWAPPPQSASSSVVASATFSTSATPSVSFTSSDDGWKSTGIPVNKQGQALPPLPVSGYQSPKGSPFMNDSAPMDNPIVSPASFTSGSIRVDAIAREIAQAAPQLPPAVPGFEPYSVEEPRRDARRSDTIAPGAAMAQQMHVTEMRPSSVEEKIDDWDEEVAAKPWPKPRPRAADQEDIYNEIEPQVSPPAPPQVQAQPTAPPAAPVKMFQPAPLQPQAPPPAQSEQNPFFSFDSDASGQPSADQDDPEIAALFEGEPVNSAEYQDASKKPSLGEPAYMAWLEPEPPTEEVVVISPKGAAKSLSQEFEIGSASGILKDQPITLGDLAPSSSPAEAGQNISETTEVPPVGFVAGPAESIASPFSAPAGGSGQGFASHDPNKWSAPQFEPAPAQGEAAAIPTTSESFDRPVENQYASASAQAIAAQAETAQAEAAQAEAAEAAANAAANAARKATGEHSRAAIEEGFRQAQAAFASAQAEQGFGGRDPFAVPAPQVVPPPAPVVIPEPATADPQPAAAAPTIAPDAAAEPAPAVDPAVRSLKADIERLILTLDLELEVVSAKGSEAFARRDLKGAERMIKLAETLSEYRESLTKLKDEHGHDLS